MFDLYAPLPWDAVAAAQVAGDYVPVPAREATPPADACNARRPRVRPFAYVPPAAAATTAGTVASAFDHPETVPARTLAVLRRSVLGRRFGDGAALCRALFRARRAFLGHRLDATEAARLVVAARALWRAGAPSPLGGRAF